MEKEEYGFEVNLEIIWLEYLNLTYKRRKENQSFNKNF